MSKAWIRTSQRFYRLLLKLYPKNFQQEFGQEMEYVFSEQLSDTYQNNHGKGLVHLWVKTFVDLFKSTVTEHIQHIKEGVFMNTQDKSILMKNKDIFSVFVGTALILLIPFLAMQLGTGVNWDETDFLVIGALLIAAGMTFVFLSRMIKNTTHRIAIGLVILVTVLYVWAELAVGISTNLGS